jgi:hypothetical protein
MTTSTDVVTENVNKRPRCTDSAEIMSVADAITPRIRTIEVLAIGGYFLSVEAADGFSFGRSKVTR